MLGKIIKRVKEGIKSKGLPKGSSQPKAYGKALQGAMKKGGSSGVGVGY